MSFLPKDVETKFLRSRTILQPLYLAVALGEALIAFHSDWFLAAVWCLGSAQMFCLFLAERSMNEKQITWAIEEAAANLASAARVVNQADIHNAQCAEEEAEEYLGADYLPASERRKAN